MTTTVYLAAGKRTPFTRVDGPLAKSEIVALSGHVLRAMAAKLRGPIDGVIWGTVAQHVSVSNLAREASAEAGLDFSIPAHSVVMACCTSMIAAFDAAGHIARGGANLMAVGGTELMSQVQVGLTQGLSDTIRRVSQAKTLQARAQVIASLKAKDLGLDVPKVANRITGKSMGEHQEETSKVWSISRQAQDEWALLSHQRAVAGRTNGFFAQDIVETQGARDDAFPRAETTLEKLAKLKPVFDRSEKGTLTAGNSSPLTDGSAGVFVSSKAGLERLPEGAPYAELVDFEVCAIDPNRYGLLMAPAFGVPRLLLRNGLTYQDVSLYELHEAFASQILTHFAGFEDAPFLKNFGVERKGLGEFPKERVNPNGGSVALGHPFAATGARILGQAIRELWARKSGDFAIVSVCADGGLGTISLLRRP